MYGQDRDGVGGKGRRDGPLSQRGPHRRDTASPPPTPSLSPGCKRRRRRRRRRREGGREGGRRVGK